MRALRFLGALFAVFMLFGIASAVEKSVAGEKQMPANVSLVRQSLADVPIENCQARDICDLKRLLFVAEDYWLKAGKNDDYFTLMYATYETATFETLEKYAFVQFIRGAVFTSQKDPKTGSTEVTYNYAIGNFNQWLVYKIPSWIIDSREASPTYMSIEGFPRHYFYRWQKEIMPPPWITQEENIYGWGRPKMPRLYIDEDDLSWASVSDGVARNVSLEFKTCLYKSEEVPLVTTRDNVNFAEPLYCFLWRSSFVYNHDAKKFESPTGLVFPGLTGPNELVILGDRQK